MSAIICCSVSIIQKSLRIALMLLLSVLLFSSPVSAFALSTVTLTLDDGNASEATRDPGSFTVARTDDGNLAEALVVRVAITGTAQRDIDYSRQGLDWPGGDDFFVTIPADQLTKTVTLKPYQDNLAEGEELATFTLQELGGNYTVGINSEASIAIADFADLLFKNSFDRPDPMPPIDIAVSLESADAISGVIGPDGGVLSTTGPDGSSFELTIPAGALLQTTMINLTPVTALLPAPFAESLAASFVAGVQLEPSGLYFTQPLELTIVPASGVDPSIWAWAYDGDGEGLHPEPYTVEGTAVSMDIWHFSGFGFSINWSEALQNFGDFAAATAEQIAELAIENVISSCVGDGCQFDPDDKAALISIFANWYTSGVLTLLNNAIANPALAKPALTQWLKWMEGIELYDLNDSGALDNLWWGSRPLAKRVIDAAFDAATLKCDGVGSKAEALADFTEPWYWITYYLELALKIDNGDSYAISDLEKCAAAKVSNATFPSGLDDAESGELKVRVGVAFRGAFGWTRYDMYPDVTLTLSGISAAPGSGTLAPDDDGWFISTLTMEGTDTATVELKANVEISPVTGITYESVNSETYTIKQKSFLSLQGKPGPPEESGSFSETVTIEPSKQATIQATVFVDAAPAIGKSVTFTLDGPGMISSSPVLTDNDGLATITFDAPDEAGQSTVTASHTTDTAKFLDDKITITYGASVEISPAAVLVNAGGTIEFTATTTNLSPQKVTWTATGGASIQSTGDLTATWTAPADAGGYTITAKSVANNDITGSATATVELSGEPTGQYSEGFYYGRHLDPCEFVPWYNDGEPASYCPDRIERTPRAWMRIHSDSGSTEVELFTFGKEAVGWSPHLSPPWQKISNPSYPHFVYRAWYRHLVLPVGSTGSTTTLPAQPAMSEFRKCYISCLRGAGGFFGTYWPWPGVIRFGEDNVTVIYKSEGEISQQRRWLFVKDTERDPFGEWAFDPRSLETPEEYRN